MSRKSVRIIAADCETDPFRHLRDPEPFIWGTYDGKEFLTFRRTEDFVEWIVRQKAICYAHNGGKFDFMFMLELLAKHGLKRIKCQIINGRIVKMQVGKCEFRDSFAAIPIALKTVGKKEIDYNKLEKHCREQHMPEIVEYLKQDCLSLYELMVRYRKIAGTQPTIASNALKYCKNIIKVNPGKTNAHFDESFRPFYYGGRTECFWMGEHRDFHILDIHSAYPYAMTHDHPVGAENVSITTAEFNRLTKAEQQRCFLTITATTKYGCLPYRTKTGLEFPVGRYKFFATGWEFIAAKELGLLSDIVIDDIFKLTETINFTPYIEHWYKYKDEHSKKDKHGNRLFPIEYEIGKRMQNALYGKLSQDPARYYDYELHKAGDTVDRHNGWELADEYNKIEFHRRPSLWKYEQEFGGRDWRGRPLYNNVATGASITGFTRAHLLKAIHLIGPRHIIYCDTDSLMIAKSGNYKKLPLSSKLGDWEYEQPGGHGYFAGKKLYAVRTPGLKDKIATKGGKLTFEQMGKLLQGEIVVWNNDAPTFSLAGRPSYVSRSFRSTGKPIPANALSN